MRSPNRDPEAVVARAREQLLATVSRRRIRPLVNRLGREGLDDLAVEVARVANDRGVVCYGRTRDEERAALKAVLNRLATLVGSYTPPESEALFALLKFIDAWSDELTASAARPVTPNVN